MVRVAFITGVSGQDGSYLAELLLEKGYEIHGFARRSSNHQNLTRISEVVDNSRFHLHVGDMTDSTSIQNILTEIWSSIKNRAEVFELYNLAAQSHVGQSFSMPEFTAKVDALAPLSLLEWMRTQSEEDRRKIRFYQASTSELYGKVMEVPQNEKTPFYPRSPYAVAKLYAYWIVRNYRESYGLYAVNGILFNHESPRRGDDFVTRKITRGLANISQGLEDCLYIGNMDALRDWGHAKDYVRMQWMMLQQDQPEDFVIATGVQYSVRQFIQWSASVLGITLEFQGQGVDEVAVVSHIKGENVSALQVGQTVVKIDPRYFRPTEVETLLGDPSKAKQKLGWVPEITVQEMCREMVLEDLAQAKQHALLKANGYRVNVSQE